MFLLDHSGIEEFQNSSSHLRQTRTIGLKPSAFPTFLFLRGKMDMERMPFVRLKRQLLQEIEASTGSNLVVELFGGLRHPTPLYPPQKEAGLAEKYYRDLRVSAWVQSKQSPNVEQSRMKYLQSYMTPARIRTGPLHYSGSARMRIFSPTSSTSRSNRGRWAPRRHWSVYGARYGECCTPMTRALCRDRRVGWS